MSLKEIRTGQEELRTAQEQLRAGQDDVRAGQEDLRLGIVKAEVRRVRKELNCWVSNCRTQQESTEFKRAVISFYNMAVTIEGDRIVQAKCMVSQAVAPYNDLRPAHLVKHSTPHLMYLYGLSADDINHPRNGMLMLDSIEKGFDHLDVCFLYNVMSQVLVVKVLNPALSSIRILPNSPAETRTFSNIDGATVLINEKMPYRRILSVHAKFAYSRALSKGWIDNNETLATYFDASDRGVDEPECICTLTWAEMDYKEILTTI